MERGHGKGSRLQKNLAQLQKEWSGGRRICVDCLEKRMKGHMPHILYQGLLLDDFHFFFFIIPNNLSFLFNKLVFLLQLENQPTFRLNLF